MSVRNPEESLKEVYHSGTQALAWRGRAKHQVLPGDQIDFEALLAGPDPQAAVQETNALALYQAINERGPEDCLDVLQQISSEQMTAFLDFDAWTADDKLSITHAMRWFDLYKAIDPVQMATRYRELEEEYQIAFLNPFLEIIEQDSYEKLNDQEQDRLYSLPGKELHYRVKTDDPKVHEFIENLIDGMLQVDLDYTFSLLAHAAALPPNEEEDKLRQFRRARLEEEGFVTYDEGLSFFKPLGEADYLESKWRNQNIAGLVPANDDALFIDRVFASLKDDASNELIENQTRAFAMIANAICAVSKVTPDDLTGIRRILEQAKVLISFALETLAEGNLQLGAEILKAEHPKTLFRYGLRKFDDLRLSVIKSFSDLGYESVAKDMERLSRQLKFGEILFLIDTKLLPIVGFEASETLKGLFNRFPLLPKETETVSDKVSRVVFKPIDSRKDFLSLTEMVHSILVDVPKVQ